MHLRRIGQSVSWVKFNEEWGHTPTFEEADTVELIIGSVPLLVLRRITDISTEVEWIDDFGTPQQRIYLNRSLRHVVIEDTQ